MDDRTELSELSESLRRSSAEDRSDSHVRRETHKFADKYRTKSGTEKGKNSHGELNPGAKGLELNHENREVSKTSAEGRSSEMS